jgi:carbon storage regulator CsrA
MLVLSRKVGERLVIDGNITVVVTKVAGNRVTIGIEAPDIVRIVRGELDVPRGLLSSPFQQGAPRGGQFSKHRFQSGQLHSAWPSSRRDETNRRASF